MESNNSSTTSQHTPTAPLPLTREEYSSPATEVPPLVRTEVSSTSPTAPGTLNTTAAAATTTTSYATTGVVARWTTAPALPPLPLSSAPRLSPVNAASGVTVTTVPAHASSASATVVPFATLHSVAAAASPHVTSSASLAGTDANGADETPAEAEPILTNGSIALAEFTSLLRPSENTNVLREHIIHLLQDVDTEDTLVRIARTLEAQEGTHSPAEVSSTTWNESSRFTPMTNASQSTGASVSLSAKHSRRSSAVSRHEATSFEALAGFSFLHSHRRTTSTQDSPSSHQPSEDAALQNRSTRGGPMEVSFNSQSSQPGRGADSRRTSNYKSRDDASSSMTATRVSQMSETTAALRVDPLQTEAPLLPTAVRREGRRVAVSAAPCAAPPSFLGGNDASSGEAGAEPAGVVQPPPPLRVVVKTAAEEQQLRRLLRRCHSFANLEADVLEDVVRAMEKEVHAAGTAILEQGQDSSEKMYLVGEGTCDAIKNGKSMGPLQPGGTFGELELMYKQAKCAATIRCVTRCVLYSLDEASYHRAVMTNSLQKRKKFEKLTLNVPFLRCMPDFERMKIAEALVTREYRRGQSIIKFGSPGTYMHFVVEGEVRVVGRNNGRRVEVVRLHAGDVVGELEFLFNHLTVADVVAISHRVVTACISREHFELIIGPIQDRLKEFVATSSTYENYYLSEVADESVRSELSRIESTRKHRRVASRENAMTLEDVNSHGEVLLSAPLALLHGKGKRGADGAEAYTKKDGRGRGAAALASTTALLDAAPQDAVRLPKALLRFPFAPVAGKDVAVLAMREDGLIIYWNAVLERLTSYSAEEVVGQNIYSFLLAEREQKSMLKAITAARNFAGDADAFLERPSTKGSQFTLARSDGLTKTTIQLTVVPPVVSAGNDAAEVVLGFGEEVKQGPQRMLEQPQWLSAQIRGILADGTQTFEERLEYIAETLNNFESTYRAMTVSTERLRVVNIRQMVGHVLMDFGSEFVTRGVSVRQRFEGVPSERAYLDADLLPECLRYAMKLCLKFSQVGGGVVTIMITVTEKNGLEFLIVNFNLAGDGLPAEIAHFFDSSFDQRAHPPEEDTSADEDDDDEDDETNSASESATPKRGLAPRLRRKLRRVQRAVEEQGGTLRIQRNAEDANIVFLIPFMPASDEDVENASVEESLHTLLDSSSQSVSLTSLPPAMGGPTSSARGVGAAAGGSRLLPANRSEDVGSVSAPPTPGDESALLLTSSSAPNQPNFSFTTCLAEDTPAHRIMLSSFLWERRHAVLTAFKFEDVVKLFGVADILIIDLQQSVITSLHDDDPISRLREMLRHMSVVITSTSFDLVSSDTYEAAGFITLKKPCTPVQAMKAIRRAEEKSAVVKLERIRIEQTRETLARNSRGAWRRGALLGKGSFGEVYEAYDVLTGGRMAVKEMRLGGNDAKIEQFVQEISTMCNLQHPNIIHYFYCEESKEQKVIRVFMEFAGGGTLQSLLKKKGKLEHAELRALLRDVVEGLAYIHSQHYVHCDIKTANVLLSVEGKGKIGDFGTAHTVHDGELLYVMQGSPLYMSPECMSAGEEDEDGTRIGYSFASDIWSLGCVAMEMATTKPPFSHIKNMKGPAGLTNFITSLTDVPDLSPLFKCEPSVVEFVSACLNPDPAQRATAQELLQMSLFSESTHSDRNSAVKALKRAQLLHVLNKFVAFQEPAEAVELERRRNRFKVRRRSSDFFSSSSSGGEGKSGANAGGGGSARVSPSSTSTSSSDLSKQVKAVQLGELKSAGGGVNDQREATAVPKNGDDSDSEVPRRSETLAHLGDGAGAAEEAKRSATTSTTRRTAAATAASAAAEPAKGYGDGEGENKGETTGTQFFRSLRRWHSSSSSTASSTSSGHPAGAVQDDIERRSAPKGLLSATQAPTMVPTPESAPLTAHASVTNTNTFAAEAQQNTPVRPARHRDPAAHARDDDEPDPRRPASEDAYDLSPTPKKRSKTQSRPPPPLQQQLEPERPGATAVTAAKKSKAANARTQRRSSSSSSRGSNSTNSNEAAFFASSSSSSASCRSEDEAEGTRRRLEPSPLQPPQQQQQQVAQTRFPAVLKNVAAVHAITTAAAADADAFGKSDLSSPLTADAAPSSRAAAVAAHSNSPAPSQPYSPTAHLPSSVADRSTAASTATVSAVASNDMPVFTGRRRNVTLDEEGNIVPFQRYTSSGSVAASKDSRGAGGTAGSRGQVTPKLGAVAAVAAAASSSAAASAPLHDNASPLGHAGEHPSSPGAVTVSSAAPVVTNVSFAQQQPNMSFYNFSFNKNVSFMGANIDEVLSSAANDFLNSLAAANNNSYAVHAAAPGASSVFSADMHSAPSHVTERHGSTHSSNHDGDTHMDNVPIFSSPLAPDTPTTRGSGHGDVMTVHRVSSSQCSLLSRSPSATLPVPNRSADNPTVEGAAVHGSAGSTSHSTSRHGSPLPQAPRMSAPHASSRSNTSTLETETASTTPRGNSVPLVGANASMARRPPRVRPPITNQSFFVVEDLGVPTLSNNSMALSVTPFFALGSVGVNASMTGGNAFTASVAPMSAAAASVASPGGGGGGGGMSAERESASSLFRHAPNIAVVAPPPLLSAFASTTAARDAWKGRRRMGASSTLLSSSRPALPPSRDGSHYGGPSSAHAKDADLLSANSGVIASMAAMPAEEDSMYYDAAASSEAFGSVQSYTSRRSSAPCDVPFLTAERLQQVAGKPAPRASTGSLLHPAQERLSSDGHSAVLFNSLTSHEESPLFTYLKRIDQTLMDVSAQLHTRRRGGSELVVAVDPNTAQQQLQQQQHRSPPLPSPLLVAANPPPASFGPPTESASASAASSLGCGGTAAASSTSPSPLLQRVSGARGRTSLPRPLSSAPGSLAASTTRAAATTTTATIPTRGTPPLGPQASRGNPLWPAEDHRGDGTEYSFPPVPHSRATSSAAESPAASSAAVVGAALEGIASSAAASRSRDGSVDVETGMVGGSGNVEVLLHKMLKRVNTLIEQLSRLPPTVATAVVVQQQQVPLASSVTSTPAKAPRGVEGAV